MTLRLIAGRFKGRLLKTPKGSSTRPTQGMLREAVFNICQNEIPGARFLDLFAGSGAMAFEALSRGASQVTLVEQNRFAIACIRENIATLDVSSQATLLSFSANKAIQYLTKRGDQFDVVYLDPPYDIRFDPTPLLPLLAPSALIFLEERAEKKASPPSFVPLRLLDSRRFGIALLSLFSRL